MEKKLMIEKRQLIVALGLASLLLSGCAPYWYHDQFSTVIYPKGHKGAGGGQEIYQGMNKNQVIALVGEPQEKRKTKENKEIWIYSRLMEGGSKAMLTFVNDKIERIDEFLLEGFFKNKGAILGTQDLIRTNKYCVYRKVLKI